MEPLTTNATVLTVVYAADGLRHVGGFQLGIAPHGVQAAPQPPVEARTRSRAFVLDVRAQVASVRSATLLDREPDRCVQLPRVRACTGWNSAPSRC